MSWASEIREFKRALILQALQDNDGNRTKAAKSLGMNRQHMQRQMRKLAVPIRCHLGNKAWRELRC